MNIIEQIRSILEQIKAEIERRITDNTFGAKLELIDILAWLDAFEKSNLKDFPTTDEGIKQFLATHPKVELPEKYKTPDWIFEKSEGLVSADLEEASDKYAEKHGFRVPYDGSANFYDDVDVKVSKEGFIAGAKWDREQMMKETERSPKPELTWDDIAKIDALILEANNEFAVDYSKEIGRKQFYTEVLNRFNKSKEAE